MKLKITAVLLALPLLASCVTRGKDFPSNFAWIKKNQTTSNEIHSILGDPYKVGHSQGYQTWTYGYYQMKLFGQSHTKELKFYLKDKMVHDFSFSSSFPEDKKNL